MATWSAGVVKAEAVAQLQHPRIVQIYKVNSHRGRPYIVVELIEGAPWRPAWPASARSGRSTLPAWSSRAATIRISFVVDIERNDRCGVRRAGNGDCF
jgi:hypothetical protein